MHLDCSASEAYKPTRASHLLDRVGKGSVTGLRRADAVLQAGQSAHHVILVLDGWVAHTGAGADAQLEPAKAGVPTLVAHEGVQLLMVDVPAEGQGGLRTTHRQNSSMVLSACGTTGPQIASASASLTAARLVKYMQSLSLSACDIWSYMTDCQTLLPVNAQHEQQDSPKAADRKASGVSPRKAK